MKIDTGRAVVIVAVLVFYLRLIILQRERARQMKQASATDANGKKKPAQSAVYYSIISQKPLDRFISGAGVVLIVAGIFFYVWVPAIDGIQPYWWIPTALGILAFSWGFKL